MIVEAHVDFEANKVVVLVEDRPLAAPAISMTNVKVVEDSEGAILCGELVETLPRLPRLGHMFRVARFTRAGQVVDRKNQRVVRSTKAAVVTPHNVYYVWG